MVAVRWFCESGRELRRGRGVLRPGAGRRPRSVSSPWHAIRRRSCATGTFSWKISECGRWLLVSAGRSPPRRRWRWRWRWMRRWCEPHWQFHMMWPLILAKLKNAPVFGENVTQKRRNNQKYAAIKLQRNCCEQRTNAQFPLARRDFADRRGGFWARRARRRCRRRSPTRQATSS